MNEMHYYYSNAITLCILQHIVRHSPPVSAQQADLIRHQALLQKGDIRAEGGAHVLILGNGQFHDAVDESQGEAQVRQAVCVGLLSKETTRDGATVGTGELVGRV